MKHIYTFFICLLVLTGGSLQAQFALERFVFASGGAEEETTTGLAASYTIGEPIAGFSETLGGTLIVIMGFQQPSELDSVDVSLEEVREVVVNYEVFPNPTAGLLNLKVSSEQRAALTAKILDIRGRETTVPSQQLNFVGGYETVFDLSILSEGTYLLQLLEENGTLRKTLKIQKVE